MQRPNRVTPTKIPSLGVIVRLVSFTGASPGGLHARCDWRNYSRHDIVKSFSTWLPSLLGRTTPVTKVAIVSGGGACREADQDAGIGGAAATCRGYNQHRNVKSGEKQCRNSKW